MISRKLSGTMRSKLKSLLPGEAEINPISSRAAPEGVGREEVLRLAALAEQQSKHALAVMYHIKAIELWGEKPEAWQRIAHLQNTMGRLNEAEMSLANAIRLDPRNPRYQLDLGDVYLRKHDYDAAEAAFWTAARLDPARPEPAERLRALADLVDAVKARHVTTARELIDRDEQLDRLARVENPLGIDPGLFHPTQADMLRGQRPGFMITFLGIEHRTRWGPGPVVRGIGSFRGHVLSDAPFHGLEIYLDGELVHAGQLTPGAAIVGESYPDLRKFSFNAWIDFTRFSLGWHDVIFTALGSGGHVKEEVSWVRRSIIIDAPLPGDFFAEAMARVPSLDASGSRSLVERVRALPSVVAEASPNSYPGPIRNVAVLRLDGLGDVAVSVPFFRRLRRLLPDAKIVALASADNADGCRALGLFDEVLAIEFPENPYREGRYLSEEAQIALMDKLATYKFDLAITGMVSQGPRELAVMTGAPVTIGFGGDDPKTLSIHYDTRDPKSGGNILNYAARYGMLARALEVWLDSGARVQRRESLRRELLTTLGVGTSERYIVLHTGSRIASTEWPGYAALAQRVATQLEMTVVYVANDPSQRSLLPDELVSDGKIIFVSGLLPFDQFDALLSFCSVFVGNDSGPGHLATLRGAKAIRILSARIGATEWKSELSGVSLYRRVPCAGCGPIPIYRPDECTFDIACVKDISIDEVYEQVVRLAAKETDFEVSVTAGHLPTGKVA